MNITSGFKATGIWPFNENIFTDADFLCASVTDRPYEDEPDLEKNEASTSTEDTTHLSENQVISNPSPSTSGGLGHAASVNLERHSTSGGFAVSPENILPYPKAGKRKITNRGRQKGKTMIAIDTPNKNDIEEKHRQREEKKRIREEKK